MKMDLPRVPAWRRFLVDRCRRQAKRLRNDRCERMEEGEAELLEESVSAVIGAEVAMRMALRRCAVGGQNRRAAMLAASNDERLGLEGGALRNGDERARDGRVTDADDQGRRIERLRDHVDDLDRLSERLRQQARIAGAEHR
ncbi:MAG TPA: hypothetical protein VM925_12815 [Labilithrix sp.]|nr:hypothetical protein [Labilithrix sp.]